MWLNGRNKRHRGRNRELSLLKDDIVICMKSHKESTQKATKTNMQKSVIFLCISDKHLEIQI